MDGLKIKERIRELHLTSRQVAATMGVAEQSMSSIYKSTDVRKNTLERIDAAIRKLTNNEKGLVEEYVQEEVPAHTVMQSPVIDQGSIINAAIAAKDELIAMLRKQIELSDSMHKREISLLNDENQLLMMRLKDKDDLIASLRRQVDLMNSSSSIPFTDLAAESPNANS